MRTALSRYCLLSLVIAGLSRPAVACEPDKVLTNNNTPIYISDVSVSLGESDCPDAGLDIRQPVVSQGQRVQFWFRIQGSRDYLSSPVSRQPFDVRFFRKDVGRLIFFDAIGVSAVDPKVAASEASRNRGRFDWRIWVRKRIFDVPGSYVVSVSQGTTEICVVNGGQRQCAIEFRVE